METTTKLTNAELVLALKIFRRWESQWASYQSDCEDWSKQGFRPQYCFHGRNMWVDYDCVCGTCEDLGYYSFDAHGYRRLSLDQAIHAYAEMNRRTKVLMTLMEMGAPATETMALGEWACQPVSQYNDY